MADDTLPAPAATTPNVVDGVDGPNVSSELVTGLLSLAERRARDSGRAIAAALIAGKPMRWAALEGGVHPSTVDKWMRQDAELRQCLTMCEQLGFARTIDSELYHVAMDRSHRGQVRALEVIAKARQPEYRDKVQMEMTVRHAAEQAQDAVTDGWKPNDAAS